MLVSYKWLQSYFEKPLPPVEEVVHAFTFGAFEIEGTEEKHGDTIIDIKVLPDRACYCLSHRGIAKELSALLGVPLKQDPFVKSIPALTPTSATLTVSADSARCPYYATALIKGVHVAPSPQWLKEALESMGQRSINNVVDATNYVMLDLGTPLHAFDAKKTSGHIAVRAAVEGETITLLGGVEKILTGTETVIADSDTGAALALAGVKGGVLAELDTDTTDIIVEAATFDPVITRKTAAKHDVRTDASKRFENKVAPVLPAHGMEAVVSLITTVAGGVVEGYAHTDMPVTAPYKLGVSVAEVNRVLGTAMEEGQVRALVERLGYAHEYLTDPRHTFLEAIKAQRGKPYKLGASVTKEAPNLFDCSSLVAYAAAQAGVSVPRISIDQYAWTERVTKAELQPGDLVFFNTQKDQTKVWFETKEFLPGTKVAEGISHVGVYMGDGMIVHARKTENAVVEELLSEVEKRVEATVGYGRIPALTSPRIVITAPPERYDLRIKEDLIEEIGRVFGYGNIAATPLPKKPVTQRILSTHALGELARAALAARSFQEVYTYALRSTGDAVLSNALASDKSALRSNLSDGLHEAVTLNEY
jgi:phenylalanyl-tRNA synthetase beta subunit